MTSLVSFGEWPNLYQPNQCQPNQCQPNQGGFISEHAAKLRLNRLERWPEAPECLWKWCWGEIAPKQSQMPLFPGAG